MVKVQTPRSLFEVGFIVRTFISSLKNDKEGLNEVETVCPSGSVATGKLYCSSELSGTTWLEGTWLPIVGGAFGSTDS